MVHEKSCGAVLFTRLGETIHYVLVKSSYWGLPKGHVEGDETEEETAIREILEETGVHAKLHNGFRSVIEYDIHEHCIKKQVVFFVAEYENQQPRHNLHEISDIAVVPIDEAISMVTFDKMRQVLIDADKWIAEEKT